MNDLKGRVQLSLKTETEQCKALFLYKNSTLGLFVFCFLMNVSFTLL